MLSVLKRFYFSLPKGGWGRSLCWQAFFLALTALNGLHSVLPFFLGRWLLSLVGIAVDRRSFVHRGVRFFSIDNFFIDSYSTVNRGCYLDNRERITIGKSVSIAHDVRIYT